MKKVLSQTVLDAVKKFKAMDPKDLIPHIDRSYNVAVIGHVDHGKTTLTSAILTEVSKTFGLSAAKDYNSVKKTAEERTRGVTIVVSTNEAFMVDDEAKLVRFVLVDCPGHRDFIKNMVAGTSNADFCIITVSAAKGVEPQTMAHLQLIKPLYQAKKEEERCLGVVITQTDLVGGDAELIELIEAQIHETLEKFQKEKTFTSLEFFSCSAYEALNGNAEEQERVYGIADKIVNGFPKPQRPIDADLYMNVEQIYNVPGRGMVAAGTVAAGVMKPGDKVDVLVAKSGKVYQTTVTSIEAFKKSLPTAVAGDNVGCLLRMVDGLDQMEKGSVIAKVGTIPLKRGFVADVYLYEADEGGRSSVTETGFQPSLFYGVQQYTVTIIFLTGLEDSDRAKVIQLVQEGAKANGSDAKSSELRSLTSAFKGAEPGSNHQCVVILNDSKCRIPLRVGGKGTGQEGHQNRMAFSILEVF
jgi:elongation factor Tu